MPWNLSQESLIILVFAQLLIATAMVALIWCVQLVIYPQFNEVGEREWHDYHQHYMRRFSYIVVPVMCLEIALAGLSLFAFEDRLLPVIGFLLVGALWGSTGLIQVPLHRQLSTGFSQQARRRLILTNWIRTILWTARWALLLWWLTILRSDYLEIAGILS